MKCAECVNECKAEGGLCTPMDYRIASGYEGNRDSHVLRRQTRGLGWRVRVIRWRVVAKRPWA